MNIVIVLTFLSIIALLSYLIVTNRRADKLYNMTRDDIEKRAQERKEYAKKITDIMSNVDSGKTRAGSAVAADIAELRSKIRGTTK